MSDPYGGVYKKLVIQDDKLVGACLYGDTVDGSWYFKLLRDGRKVADIRDKLMFGESNIGDVGHQGHNKAAAMADSDEVCGCNGVTKGTICKAIKDKGLFTLDEVRKHTKASASLRLVHRAGGAAADVHRRRRLQRHAQEEGDVRLHRPRPPGVRDAIRAQHLLTIDDVYNAGLAHAQRLRQLPPGVNYYLISTWPKEAQDDPQSRYINERSHANIQKDGTYSVIPRMWGGETTADELRRIADAVDKYKIPTVKVTGGQRIDLLGVKKEDLPACGRTSACPAATPMPRRCAR
jgi:nitrite reductase (NADH) large subunit